ncbi:MAG: SDR family NAD(P)-dependent oxidoreductase [Thermoflexaceae bacterium]|nr:SDR family NAD(P)-dependent oxidoreductase [Thermoflexaceae bacterium]
MAGKVVALIGTGSELDRAIAVACAEAGANIALGTVDRSQEQDFGVNSIANELWAIGREHFVRVMDATEATEVASFADETWDRLGRCDALLAIHELFAAVELDELSPDEWERSLRVNLTGPFLAGQAFGRLMERQGAGAVVFVTIERTGGDAAWTAAHAGLEGLADHIGRAWGEAGVSARVVRAGASDPAEGARAVLAVITNHM